MFMVHSLSKKPLIAKKYDSTLLYIDPQTPSKLESGHFIGSS